MPFVDTDLSQVIEEGLCISCGACVHADPSLKLVLDERRQIWQPSASGGPEAAKVCPAIAVDFPWLQARRFPGRKPGAFGVVDQVMLAQSRDLERNLAASSGGIIKELLRHLLARIDVDGAIVLKHVAGVEFASTLIRDPADVDQLPGSIYHNLPKHHVLKLLRDTPGRFVLVGIPCELEGIFNYIYAFAPDLAERVHSTIGLLCGWQYSHHALRAICEYKGIDFNDLTNVEYRGGGPIGKLRLHTSKASFAVSRRVDFFYQAAFDRAFNARRCHLCVNHSNFLADIVVGDAWLPSTVTTRTGISLVVCRNETMTAVMRELHSSGCITLTQCTEAEVVESQSHRVAMGDFAYAYAEYLDAQGRHRPKMTGPNFPYATPASRKEVKHFDEELNEKQRLIWGRRYRRLVLRKSTREFGRLSWKYLRWFLVRVLKVKSLFWRRREIPASQLKGFR
ncbi:Coenzyme F420 hydrogenase/dehydrogenase, beta subunit C-terminal domain [Thiohalocapsa sp. ML1]|jgi:coenzyme F420 hydrogenase subunit beta|uniref:Coenzyme F420 hydrogenase/dehydrogenase, beta subunit C-terminal domain n=1 Tax=Thiohalocapsa sp. ML1 TaxID=1431688 RepID=UPI00138ED7F6|nr:Coenzyme F420 hydrogenase/dehydrogenase, beta subunit C-terminal domain [Thiohalocapsa sp. ML1]